MAERDKNYLTIWNFPKELKMSLKVKCAQEGISMKDAIIKLVTTYIEE